MRRATMLLWGYCILVAWNGREAAKDTTAVRPAIICPTPEQNFLDNQAMFSYYADYCWKFVALLVVMNEPVDLRA